MTAVFEHTNGFYNFCFFRTIIQFIYIILITLPSKSSRRSKLYDDLNEKMAINSKL